MYVLCAVVASASSSSINLFVVISDQGILQMLIQWRYSDQYNIVGCMVRHLSCKVSYIGSQVQRVDYRLLLFPVVFLFHVINGTTSSAYGMPTGFLFGSSPTLKIYQRRTHCQQLSLITTRTLYRGSSFLPRTIRDWNSLSTDAVEATTVDTFVSHASH